MDFERISLLITPDSAPVMNGEGDSQRCFRSPVKHLALVQEERVPQRGCDLVDHLGRKHSIGNVVGRSAGG